MLDKSWSAAKYRQCSEEYSGLYWLLNLLPGYMLSSTKLPKLKLSSSVPICHAQCDIAAEHVLRKIHHCTFWRKNFSTTTFLGFYPKMSYFISKKFWWPFLVIDLFLRFYLPENMKIFHFICQKSLWLFLVVRLFLRLCSFNIIHTLILFPIL